MSNSTVRRSGVKARPKKPHKSFPLYAHAAGSWAKKVRGKTVYFTKWVDDPKGVAALEMWLEQKDDLLAGRTPRRKTDELTVADLSNQFLTSKADARDTGELSPRTFQTYYISCRMLVDHFGKGRLVCDLHPSDFASLRKSLSKRLGMVALGNEITRIRSVFNFAIAFDLVDNPIRFGPDFKRPRKDIVKKERQAHRLEHGKRMIEANELRQILAAAEQPLRAMILLGINTGFGNTDLASLPRQAVDLDKGWIDFPRPKTSTDRRVPLWPETIEAIRDWLPLRPEPVDQAYSMLVFLTYKGNRFVKATKEGAPQDVLGQQFSKLLVTLGLKRKRLSFYALRHTFETIAGATADQVAVNLCMGHADSSMASHYREGVGDDRLRRVVEHVRQWLFETPDDDSTDTRSTSKAKPSAKKLSSDSDTDTGIRLFIG